MVTVVPSFERELPAKPILKWAGGKSQLLKELKPLVPKKFNQYIEPFFGGGALFFSMQPERAVIADTNPELINLYRCVQKNPQKLIELLRKTNNTEEDFYAVRAREFESLGRFEAAARTFFLNKTCFNGLYRVNRKGHFNVPYGRYKNPNLCPEDVILAAARVLKTASIELGDYRQVLQKHARPGDFVFLDPPYLPISEYSDFKRYTKEQFGEDDHRQLADEATRLGQIGCHVVLTNSNHPLVHELYKPHAVKVVATKRHISSKGSKRAGEDAIVTVTPKAKRSSAHGLSAKPLEEQIEKFPPTRFMGSKEKIIPHIRDIASQFEFESALDLFSGSGVVGYLFKTMGKRVVANDYMAMSAVFAQAMIENNHHTLSPAQIDRLFEPGKNVSSFVADTFENIYFSDEDNQLIDVVMTNIKQMRHPERKAIAKTALIRACMKKRARGIFTYTGLRYDDGRADLKLSLEQHVRNAVELVNDAVFDNGHTSATRRGDALSIRHKADLVYLDPPYFSPLSDNEYVRRYHFVEGIACDWQGVEMQWHTKTRKFKSYPTPFSTRAGAEQAFDAIFHKMQDSIIMVSYSSNSLPTKDEILGLMKKYKSRVEVVDVDHRYSFGTQHRSNRNAVKEYLFVGY